MVCNDAISVFLKYLMKQYVILSTKKHIKPIEKMYMMTFLGVILSPKPFMIECSYWRLSLSKYSITFLQITSHTRNADSYNQESTISIVVKNYGVLCWASFLFTMNLYRNQFGIINNSYRLGILYINRTIREYGLNEDVTANLKLNVKSLNILTVARLIIVIFFVSCVL